ncbi:hypothetical protein F4604DRAFT_1930771 [Suillus subluteus]|nr:hypothetical protein F4604DRAFT_1930771 [Suillus subluteus]
MVTVVVGKLFGVLLNADGLELEDGPEDTGDIHAVLPDNDDNEPIILVPVKTPPHLPSPQSHAPPTTPTVKASTMNMPDNSQVAHPRVPRACTAPACNRVSHTFTFNWPHLSLSDKVLSIMGLAATSIIHVWNHSQREWQGVQPGYVITVVECQPILLKNPSITNCIDFDSCIRCTNDSPPNICTYLAAECAAVHLDLRKYNNTLPNADEVVFCPHVKLHTSSSELEVEALLLLKGKGKDPANRSPSLSTITHSRLSPPHCIQPIPFHPSAYHPSAYHLHLQSLNSLSAVVVHPSARCDNHIGARHVYLHKP